MNKNTLAFLGLFTLFGFGALGQFIIQQWHDFTLWEVTKGHQPLWLQIPVGLLYGGVMAYFGWLIIKSKPLKPIRSKYGKLIQKLNLNTADIFLLSLCAGVGEEILFRGAIQPFLGVWLTALVFVGIHGYLNPMNWRISIYGAFMTVIIAGLGYFTEYWGLATAMAGHFAIDVVLLFALTRDDLTVQNTDVTEYEEQL